MFETLGLTAAESHGYADLVERGACTPAELALRWHTTDAEAMDIVAGLARKGLVLEVAGPPRRIGPTPPDVALEGLVADREAELRQARLAIRGLTERYRRGPVAQDPAELMETITGVDEVIVRWERLQRSARHEVRGFDRPPYGKPRNDLELELLGAGVAYRCVYQRTSLADRLDHIEDLVAAGEQARVIADLPIKLILIDDRYGLVPLRAVNGPESAVVIHASPLLEALCWLFEDVWTRAVPVSDAGAGRVPFVVPPPVGAGVGAGGGAEPGTARRAPADPGPDDEQRRLVRLLALGATDAAIAHQMGWSSRTVYRRLTGIFQQLDASTRFQAGVQATRRGWL